MNKDKIKKLAKLTMRNGFDEKLAKKALLNLTRKELIMYLGELKKLVYQNSVRVISSNPLSTKEQELLKSKFKDRTVFFEIDESIGAGVKIVMGDTVIDLTFKGYINNILQKL